MKITKPGATSLDIGGNVYTADEHGIIELPDHLYTPRLAHNGWVDAKGLIAQMERQAQAKPKQDAQPEPEPEPGKQEEPPIKPKPDAKAVQTADKSPKTTKAAEANTATQPIGDH